MRPYFEIANPEVPELLRPLPRKLKVLDVGCGSGVHGAELHRIFDHTVTGVDFAASSIEKAKKRLAAAYVADVTAPERYPFFGRERFDVVLFSDVLEHLSDPLEVLRRHLPLLAPGGHMAFSMPNIAIWNVRLGLLFGQFNYTDTGTLDRTHLRFYTKRSMREFVKETGFTVVESRITPGLTRAFVPLVKKFYPKPEGGEGDSATIMESATYRAYMKWAYPVERWLCRLRPQLFAFTFMVLAKPNAAQTAALEESAKGHRERVAS